MSARVREAVEDHIGKLTAKGDQVFCAISHGLRIAKNASPPFVIFFNVLHAPWGPEMFHETDFNRKPRCVWRTFFLPN